MIFALAYLGNAAANFIFGLVVSAALGPAEFGRYATAALAATVLATLAFDWLRLSTNRFWLSKPDPTRVSAGLEAGFFLVSGLLLGLAALAYWLSPDFGLGKKLIALTFVLAIFNARFDFRGARLRVREEPAGFARLSAARQVLLFTFVLAIAAHTQDAVATIAALALSQAIASLTARSHDRANMLRAHLKDLWGFAVYSAPIVAATALFMAIGLVNREIALARFGAVETGKLSLAADLGFRLFVAFNFLPETVLFQIAMRREATEGLEAASRQISLNHVYALAIIAPIALGYMAMAPTFEALLVPRAYRGDFVVLARDLAPGFLAYCAIYAICNPLFQLARQTWPIALAALAAFLGNLALASFPPCSGSVEGLALAHSASLILGFACAALMAMWRTQGKPRWRDLTAVSISSAAMALAIRPLNAIPSAPLAATLALIIGGAVFGAALIAFDVAGFRAQALARLRERRVAGLTAP